MNNSLTERISVHYENNNEDRRLTRGRHNSVEFLTTVRYVQQYLGEGMRILEIGAGTGQYSHYFARKGYKVDAVELTEHNIGIFKDNTLPGENVAVYQGNATDLSHVSGLRIADETYDITLLLGPMYHLLDERDRLSALSEAIRVTKCGGVIFSAYCLADGWIMRDYITRGIIADKIADGSLDPVTFEVRRAPNNIFAIDRKPDIDRLMSHFPQTTRLHFVSVDLLTHYIEDTVDRMDDDQFDLYLRYHFSVCERADMAGVSPHVLDVFRKNRI